MKMFYALMTFAMGTIFEIVLRGFVIVDLIFLYFSTHHPYAVSSTVWFNVYHLVCA
ncbi:hypothetical protein D3C77_672830 [compost metagenome]